MTDETRNPTTPDDPSALDRLLAGVARFTPKPGFEQRVLSLVRVPLPAWLRGVRAWFRGLTSGVRGWIVLGTFSMATAAAWGMALTLPFRFQEQITRNAYISHGSEILVRDVLSPGWAETLAWGAAQRDASLGWVSSAFEGLGIPWQVLAIGYVGLVVLSAFAVRFLMSRPVRAKG